MSRKVSSEVGNISTPNDQQVDESASEGEESETINREKKTRMTPTTDVQHRIGLSAKVAVRD